MDLSTHYLGKTLRSPLVASASPLSEHLFKIKQMEDAGVGAVVLHSLFQEQLERDQHELHHHMTYGTDSFAEALSYFPEPDTFHLGPDAYLKHIRKAKESVDIPIIASLNGSTLGGWIDFARLMEEAGADGLELNLYNIPTDINTTGGVVESRYLEVVKAVREVVSIPLAVKLSPFFSNLANMARNFADAGANGLVLFNRFYQPDIDLENLEVYPHVLLSAPQDLRLPLRWIAILYGRINVDLAATSGVHQAEDVLKMLMAGANVTMMASALLKNGIDHLRVVEADLVRWMEEHEYESVQQMRGSMSQQQSGNPSAFERAQYMRALTTYQV
jgi:dihydroorotate dehydrogenase (fumarate)